MADGPAGGLPGEVSVELGAGLLVRRAKADDLEELLALLGQLHEEEPRQRVTEHLTATFAEILASRTRAILVACRDGAIVGTLDLLVVANITRGGRPWAGIENVVVDTASRRQGAGGALLAVAVDLAREAGCSKLQLVSNEGREAAHGLYLGAGFTAPVRGFRRYL
jgi:GNAT superfamily N-acetyltransferase